MTPEEKDQLFEEEINEATDLPEPVDEFGEKIETPNTDMMADIDAPDMTDDELAEITEEHAYPGD